MPDKQAERTVVIPVLLQCPSAPVEGYIERLDDSTALIQSVGALPTAGQQCRMVLTLPLGDVRIQAGVLRVDPTARQFEVEFHRIEENGHLLVAVILRYAVLETLGGGEAPASCDEEP